MKKRIFILVSIVLSLMLPFTSHAAESLKFSSISNINVENVEKITIFPTDHMDRVAEITDKTAILNFFLVLDKIPVTEIDKNNEVLYTKSPSLDRAYEIQFSTHDSDIFNTYQIFDNGYISNYTIFMSRMPFFDYTFTDPAEVKAILDKQYMTFFTEPVKEKHDSSKKEFFSPNQITVWQNAEKVELDSPPFIENNTVYVPVRQTLNCIGVSDDQIFYDKRTITIDAPETHIILTIGEQIAVVNGENVNLNGTAEIKNDRAYVPVDFMNNYFSDINVLKNFQDEQEQIIGGVVSLTPNNIGTDLNSGEAVHEVLWYDCNQALYFKSPKNSEFIDVSGKVSFLWAKDTLVADFYAEYLVDTDIYTVRLVKTDICYENGFNGYFSIHKNGAEIEKELFAKVYIISDVDVNGDYYKFYSSQEVWHLSGYVTKR